MGARRGSDALAGHGARHLEQGRLALAACYFVGLGLVRARVPRD
jgi:hypothetical protein